MCRSLIHGGATHAHTHACTRTCMHTHMRACTCKYAHTHARTHARTHTRMHAHADIRSHTCHVTSRHVTSRRAMPHHATRTYVKYVCSVCSAIMRALGSLAVAVSKLHACTHACKHGCTDDTYVCTCTCTSVCTYSRTRAMRASRRHIPIESCRESRLPHTCPHSCARACVCTHTDRYMYFCIRTHRTWRHRTGASTCTHRHVCARVCAHARNEHELA